MSKATNLIWIDLEMTGLDTQNDHIIEIATVVTDADLNTLDEGLCWRFTSATRCWQRWMSGIPLSMVSPV